MKRYLILCFIVMFVSFSFPAFASEGLIRYEVRKGESISKIAKKYHQPAELIAVINNISEDERIRVGQTLLIPLDPASERIVLEKGDNPWDIANKYGISPEKLLAQNNIDDPTRLMPGDILNVPFTNNPEDPDIQATSKFRVAQKPEIRKPRMRLSYRNEEKFVWPVMGTISSGYGTRWGDEFHHGLDIAATYGTGVVAATGGKVIEAGYKNRIYGNAIMIESEAYTLLYGHLSEVLVKEGEEVTQGQNIGRVGDSGRSTGPHLHLEVRSGNDTLNPMRFLP